MLLLLIPPLSSLLSLFLPPPCPLLQLPSSVLLSALTYWCQGMWQLVGHHCSHAVWCVGPTPPNCLVTFATAVKHLACLGHKDWDAWNLKFNFKASDCGLMKSNDTAMLLNLASLVLVSALMEDSWWITGKILWAPWGKDLAENVLLHKQLLLSPSCKTGTWHDNSHVSYRAVVRILLRW